MIRIRTCFFFHFEGWGSKFGTTKCRTTDISEFQNCEYKITKDESFEHFIFEFNFSFEYPKYSIIFQVLKDGDQNLERTNVERPIFRKSETSNIEITKIGLLDFFFQIYFLY